MDPAVVDVKPEVVFLYELLGEISEGKIKIPRFQRDFVWRRDQMTDLLDSIRKQYPVGSLLVWETADEIATLSHLGPFEPVDTSTNMRGYVLDGHQRLTTLTAALIGTQEHMTRRDPLDSKWRLYWNVKTKEFQHASVQSGSDVLFPLTALLDTFDFFKEIETVKEKLDNFGATETVMTDLTQLARTFQSYRVPVVRIRNTELSEAVEIFARLNSKGQSMTADQMVSALSYRQDGSGSTFSLASQIDNLSEVLADHGFADVDRTTILRAVLANLDEDIYRTDWTKLVKARRDDLQIRLENVGDSTRKSLLLAVDFLRGEGVAVGRLLPYGLQLVLLSAFFDKCPNPNDAQLQVLRRWFWSSSFSAWFGAANPSRSYALLKEFREELAVTASDKLRNFDLTTPPPPSPQQL